jgi:acyl-CoA thioesterase FadM
VNPIRRYIRLVWLFLTTARRPRLHIHDVARMTMRVWPTDLDELGHVNNGVYLSMMDLPRLDLLQRSRIWPLMQKAGIYPVVASQTITYRKSLKLWQKFDVETRIIGYDDRAVYIEQRFVVEGEIYARGIVKGRFIRRSGGVVGSADLQEITGIDTTSMPIPAWLAEWSQHVALPSTRREAPSVWD